jgi:microcystin-dependent protein
MASGTTIGNAIVAAIQAVVKPTPADGGTAFMQAYWDAIATALLPYLLPTGTVSPFAGTSAPTGWLFCDGSAVSRTTYADLFTAIGTSCGTGDGSTTFNLPDYRGRFMRGVDGSAARDPDKATRTAMATGGNTGNNVGSVQADDFKQHTHTEQISTAAGGTSPPGPGGGVSGGFGSATGPAPVTGGSESRPLNAYVNYIIKT